MIAYDNLTFLDLGTEDNILAFNLVTSLTFLFIHLKNLSSLSLNFGKDSVNAEVTSLLSSALSLQKNFKFLKLDLRYNCINKEGSGMLFLGLS